MAMTAGLPHGQGGLGLGEAGQNNLMGEQHEGGGRTNGDGESTGTSYKVPVKTILNEPLPICSPMVMALRGVIRYRSTRTCSLASRHCSMAARKAWLGIRTGILPPRGTCNSG